MVLAKPLEWLIRVIVRVVLDEIRRPTNAEVVGGGEELAETVNADVDSRL